MAGLRVGFPLYQGATLLDFAGATQIFASSGFEPVWLSATLEPITTTEGVQVLPKATFADAGALDILFVPGGGEAVAQVMLDPVYVGFLCEAGAAASWAGSVCSGAFPLAAAGLLDGYEATTYWSQRENLALFPKVTVSVGYPRWVIHQNRFSGGGISSSLDLALELVSLIQGPTASMTAQLSVQYAPDPPFRAGDPSEAPPELTAKVLQGQQAFSAAIRKSVETVIG